MKILQSGAPKSGNYWLYTINRHLIEKSNIQYTSYIQNQPIYNVAKTWKLSQHNQAKVDVIDITPSQIVNRISRIYQMPIHDFEKYLDETTLSWTHSLFYNECVEFYKKFDKIVYIIRDPRAVALSAAKFQNKVYSKKYLNSLGIDPQKYLNEKLELMIKSWAINILSFLDVSNSINLYTVFYENLKQHPYESINKLADYLEIEITNKQLDEIVEAVSLEYMKEKNPEHIRKGKLYEWKNKLNNIQKFKVDLIAGSLFKLFGYPDRNGVYPKDISLNKTPSSKTLNRIKRRVYLTTGITGGWKYLTNKLNDMN